MPPLPAALDRRPAGPARRLRTTLALALSALVAAVWLYFHLAAPGTALGVWNADPEIFYLLDSLAPFKGQPYRLSQHPGTPLTALGTLLLSALFPFGRSSAERFVARLIRDPAPFFLLAHGVLAIANVACILALSGRALAVRRRYDALLAVAIPASFFAFLPQSFFWPLYWSHNAVAFPCGTAALLALLVALRRGRPLSTRTIAGLGLAAGLLSATQLYFATWALGLGVAATAVERIGPRRSWPARPLLVTLAATAAGFLVGTLPLAADYRRFFAFVRALLLHQGLYGSAAPGFTSPALWTSNLLSLLRDAPWLFVATAIAFVLLIVFFVAPRSDGSREAGLWAAVAGVSLQWLATLALFGKHPSRFYLPALAAMLPVLLALAFTLARRRGRAARLACLAVAVAVFVGCGRTAVLALREHVQRLAFRVAMDEEVRRHRVSFEGDRVRAGGPSTLLLWGPGLPDAGCYGLWAAHLYLDEAFGGEVSAVCPSEGLAWSNRVALPDAGPSLEGVTALLVALEGTRVRFPAFAALGEPTLSSVRDPNGQRLAFYRVTVLNGRARRAGS